MPKNDSANNSSDITPGSHEKENEFERLKLALEISKEGLWEWNFKTKEIYINQEFLNELGYQEIQMPLSLELSHNLIHPEDLTRINNIFDEYNQGLRDSHEIEYRIRAKSGEWRWILSRARLIERDEYGKPLRAMGTHTDITERKHEEEALEESLMLFEAQFKGSPDIILIVDQDFKIVKINRLLTSTFKIEELEGADAIQVLPAEYRDIARQKVERCFATGEIQEFEHTLTGGKWVSARIVRLTRIRKPNQLMIISSDITDRKRAEETILENERKLKQAQKIARIGSWSLDIRNNKALLSDEMYNIFGQDIKTIDINLEKVIIAAIHPEDRETAKAHYKELLEKGVSNPVEYRIVRPDGQIRYIWIEVGDKESDENGTIIRATGIVQDITDYKLAEKKITENEILYSTLVKAIPDSLIVTDIEGHIKFLSQQGQNLFGVKRPEDAIGRSILEFIVPEDVEKAMTNFQDLVQKNAMYIHEHTLLKADGTRFEGEIYASVLKDASGNITGAVGVVRDITERKEMEEKIRQSEKMDAIGQLAGGIAHDFNNELSIIMGNTELLRYEVQSNPEQLSFVDNILKGIKRSADLISQMLAFSRRGKFLLTPVNMHEIISEIIDMLKHSIDKRIIIQQKLKADPSITLGDPSQLKSAILNLSLNARDAMPDGGRLLFSTQIADLSEEFYRTAPYDIEPGRYLMVSVADTGIGMDKKIQSRIFEPFFTTKKNGEGTGMGLASVYGTVKNHKGIINVNSKPGSGSAFNLYFPLAENVSLPAEADTKITPKKHIKAHANILLVEDEDDLRHVAEKILVKLGYDVSVCKDGKEGLKYYKKNWQKIEIVILDMVMPVMNGKDAYIAMQKINPDIKALLISGYSLDGEAQAILDKGVMGFLQKPFKKDELSRKIAEVLKA